MRPREITLRKARIRNIVHKAIENGILIKQPCEVCGYWRSQAHHDDYSKPLEVKWLCSKHHAIYHRDNPWMIDNGLETLKKLIIVRYNNSPKIEECKGSIEDKLRSGKLKCSMIYYK